MPADKVKQWEKYQSDNSEPDDNFAKLGHRFMELKQGFRRAQFFKSLQQEHGNLEELMRLIMEDEDLGPIIEKIAADLVDGVEKPPPMTEATKLQQVQTRAALCLSIGAESITFKVSSPFQLILRCRTYSISSYISQQMTHCARTMASTSALLNERTGSRSTACQSTR